MSEAIRVGAELSAWCTSCRDMQWHVIVALVGGKPAKVECIHCHKQHQFRAGPPASADKPGASTPSGEKKPRAAAKGKAARTPAAPATINLAPLIAGRVPRGYSPMEAFVVGDVLRHPTFGVGVVVLLPGPQKVEVAFPAGQKLLVHDRGGASSSLPRPAARPDAPMQGTSDAPPVRPTRA